MIIFTTVFIDFLFFNAGSILNVQRVKEREFLNQLLTPTSIPDYQVPVPIEAELRSYQQAGVNWLAFLNKFDNFKFSNYFK